MTTTATAPRAFSSFSGGWVELERNENAGHPVRVLSRLMTVV